ncbi:hypothetical protein KAF44_22620 (plasmid) [Cupriavidus necator]|nr:hypothetical protein KAF44_22620 [Cupriavidus necator]
MSEATLIGIVLVKHVFHLHAKDRGAGNLAQEGNAQAVVLSDRHFPALHARHWTPAQTPIVLRENCRHSDTTRAPQYVKPFVKDNRNVVDTETSCEAAMRPTMHSVAPKTEAQPCCITSGKAWCENAWQV